MDKSLETSLFMDLQKGNNTTRLFASYARKKINDQLPILRLQKSQRPRPKKLAIPYVYQADTF